MLVTLCTTEASAAYKHITAASSVVLIARFQYWDNSTYFCTTIKSQTNKISLSIWPAFQYITQNLANIAEFLPSLAGFTKLAWNIMTKTRIAMYAYNFNISDNKAETKLCANLLIGWTNLAGWLIVDNVTVCPGCVNSDQYHNGI